MSKTVCIFGSGRISPGDLMYEQARELGRWLAVAGMTVANGGYGGVMEATARGAAEAGGKVIGVTCAAFGRSGPNGYVTQEIVTESLYERVKKLVELGDGFVVMPGGTGTLLEMAVVWEMKAKGFLAADKPVWAVGEPWRGVMRAVLQQDPASGSHLNCVEDLGKLKNSMSKQRDWL